MHWITLPIRNLFVREEGATVVQYGLMVALIAVVSMGLFSQIAASF